MNLSEAELDAITPGMVWWAGMVSCSICGYGTPAHDTIRAASVIPISEGQSAPFAMECPACRNWTLKPDDGEDSDR